MRIGGIQKTSLIDYPGHLSTVIFLRGCNFRCSYCHNAELLSIEGVQIERQKMMDELITRRSFIDSVVISGGECTLSEDLRGFIQEIKSIGYGVKLDTNGTKPDIIEPLIKEGLIDYIAMDIKAPPEKYDQIAGVCVDLDAINKSIRVIKNQMKNYEFRTTVSPEILTETEVLKIADWISDAKKYVLQNFRDNENVLCGRKKLTSYPAIRMTYLKEQLEPFFEEVILR
ncbi:anaerobic ribonucleoside-triphosphate reductase activating protein [Tindallia californiensis]|uniref:Pyruvate formate lyase activating enzyme n=1 Tax=Tindallia californiensis TaxID=159292 RepID=A0A1H3JUI5_9FIRM|nr:anaerobic ribonucleoside-triphosphate reductase activating protein [Tindallia californiensis]SDY43617.1 pyruvate formate lyase activating enzyme [Tindallia californiensis]